MKTIFKSMLALAVTCGIVGAIGIEWGVEGLTIDGELANTSGTTPNYGTDIGKYVLQLVYIGDGVTDPTIAFGNDTAETIQTGIIPTLPFAGEQAGAVQGNATGIETAGTYVMLLYNNYGGYYALSSEAGGSILGTSLIQITQTEIDNDPNNIATKSLGIVNGGVYRGALVPEPSTAALALAGIALLFRRKRA